MLDAQRCAAACRRRCRVGRARDDHAASPRPQMRWLALLVLAGCGSQTQPVEPPAPVQREARIPGKPGELAPSLAKIERTAMRGDLSDGTILADVDSCA